VLKNRTPADIEQAMVDLAIEQPGWGSVASIRIASFCSTLKRRRRSTRPSNTALG
jgi:hypothetical protein